MIHPWFQCELDDTPWFSVYLMIHPWFQCTLWYTLGFSVYLMIHHGLVCTWRYTRGFSVYFDTYKNTGGQKYISGLVVSECILVSGVLRKYTLGVKASQLSQNSECLNNLQFWGVSEYTRVYQKIHNRFWFPRNLIHTCFHDLQNLFIWVYRYFWTYIFLNPNLISFYNGEQGSIFWILNWIRQENEFIVTLQTSSRIRNIRNFHHKMVVSQILIYANKINLIILTLLSFRILDK